MSLASRARDRSGEQQFHKKRKVFPFIKKGIKALNSFRNSDIPVYPSRSEGNSEKCFLIHQQQQRLESVIQTNITTPRVAGTLASPQPHPVTSVNETLR